MKKLKHILFLSFILMQMVSVCNAQNPVESTTDISTDTGKCPCDIYASGGTPCVAAHSTVRALYSSYDGPLYQIRRTSDNQTMDIGVLTPGGFANAAAQDSFLNGKPGTISKIYDQSPNGNHLVRTPIGGWLKLEGSEANATGAMIMVKGHKAYGVYSYGNGFTDKAGVGYRNNTAKGLPIGDQPEGIYMVCSGRHYNQWCCFDYGNAETNNKDNGPGTMECIYFGNSTQWGKGTGTGPWIMADLEDGLFAGQSFAAPSSNTTIDADYVTAIVKGNSGNYWAIRGGNAQSGNLKQLYAGARPSNYNPMKKEGAILLGIGGDNSNTGEGTFFEGAITSGYPTDETENAVQENIIGAGYGSNLTTIRNNYTGLPESPFSVYFNPMNDNAAISYTLQDTRHVIMNVFDLQGRQIAEIDNGILPVGKHEAIWDTKQISSGVYVCRIAIDGEDGWTGKIIIGK